MNKYNPTLHHILMPIFKISSVITVVTAIISVLVRYVGDFDRTVVVVCSVTGIAFAVISIIMAIAILFNGTEEIDD